MSENGEGQKNQTIESDIKDNPYEAQRQRAEEIRSQSKARRIPIKKSDIDTSWMTRPEPKPQQPPQKPWNKEMVRPDKAGRYRVVKIQS